MPSYSCKLCHRPLRDSVSVKIGMGPICRARDKKQGEFDFMNAKWRVLNHVPGKYIFIEDIGHSMGRSVTSNVEYVIEQLYIEQNITHGTRVFYKDSDGSIDEIIHAAGRFKTFKPGHDGIDLGENG